MTKAMTTTGANCSVPQQRRKTKFQQGVIPTLGCLVFLLSTFSSAFLQSPLHSFHSTTSADKGTVAHRGSAGQRVPSQQQRLVSRTKSIASIQKFHSSLSLSLDIDDVAAADSSTELSSLEVVLFGVGDLRMDDHEGLQQALKMVQSNESGSRILPLVVLDQNSLENLPGAVAHSMDTAKLLVSALNNLKQGLAQDLDLPLYVLFQPKDSEDTTTSNHNVRNALLQGVIQPLVEQSSVSGLSSTATKINIHVCDLGPADNRMGYGPYGSWLQSVLEENKITTLTDDVTSKNVCVKPWLSCQLWAESWNDIATLPESYPAFEERYKTNKVMMPCQPVNQKSKEGNRMGRFAMSSTVMKDLAGVSTRIPDAVQVCEWMQSSLGLDPIRCVEEQNTGLFGTHWGGLDPTTVGESHVLETLRVYTEECQQDDEVFASKLLKSLDTYCQRNVHSLEHASMIWNLRGESVASKDGSFYPNMGNVMAGEFVTRYLAAPLWLGTVSQRRVWHACSPRKQEKQTLGELLGLQVLGNSEKTPLQSLVEAREWHRLLAARNIQTDPAYSAVEPGDKGEMKYDYFRWHGFLCRYAKSALVEMGADNDGNLDDNSGLLFVHGFGASGSQWSKTIRALADINTSDASTSTSIGRQALAPDLIGFGHSEKPPITYSGYTWEGMIGDFVKEIGRFKNKWTDYAVGGNSIGGFTAMCSAANDATTEITATRDGSKRIVLSGLGAPGTGSCSGVILMNPAGNIQTKEEVEQLLQTARNGDVNGNARLPSVAQTTASDSLPPCKPLSRPLSRAFGNGLLWYLRPRIQPICKNLYPVDPTAVDETLCNGILRDSLDPGAVYVMMSGSKLPPSRTYNELLAAEFGQSQDTSILESQFDGYVLMPQGVLDPLNDAAGRANSMGTLRKGIEIDPIQGGHCPHDEVPEAVASSISKWLQATRSDRLARVRVGGLVTDKVTSETEQVVA